MTVGQNRLPLTLDRDQSSLSLQVEVPPVKDREIELKLISEKPGCLIHPQSRRVFPMERLRSSVAFEHASYTVQEPRNGTVSSSRDLIPTQRHSMSLFQAPRRSDPPRHCHMTSRRDLMTRSLCRSLESARIRRFSACFLYRESRVSLLRQPRNFFQPSFRFFD